MTEIAEALIHGASRRSGHNLVQYRQSSFWLSRENTSVHSCSLKKPVEFSCLLCGFYLSFLECSYCVWNIYVIFSTIRGTTFSTTIREVLLFFFFIMYRISIPWPAAVAIGVSFAFILILVFMVGNSPRHKSKAKSKKTKRKRSPPPHSTPSPKRKSSQAFKRCIKCRLRIIISDSHDYCFACLGMEHSMYGCVSCLGMRWKTF